MMMRRLEDFNPNLYTPTEDYTCIIAFNEQTYVDKTKWTIRSHFATTIVFCICFLKLYFWPHHKAMFPGTVLSQRKIVERLVPLFLLMESFSHLFVGMYHLVIEEKTEETNPLKSISQMFGMFAAVILFLFALMVVMACYHKLSPVTQVIWRFGILGLWLAVIYAYMFNRSVFLGIDIHMYVLVGVCLLLLLAYGIRIFHTPTSTTNGSSSICHLFNKSLAILIVVLATAYAYSVYRKCGSYDGYLECFIRCPLPYGLNHTSFYNIAKLLALGGWAIAEDISPSVSLELLTAGLRAAGNAGTDEATVISDGPDLFEPDDDLDKEDDQGDDQDNITDDVQQDVGQDIESNENDLEEARSDSFLADDVEPRQPNEDFNNIGDKTLKLQDASLSCELEGVVDEEQASLPSVVEKG
ncbi:unnamed protein product [Cylindrotheca closterium]|uniref:Uncharacterized protein n=1 Tax=Cylindrotheca closterium TaxID=2856 RepID=A0AAD2JP11_9STRA|nr:unnamed protein product [Cylindrotheca closterium]